MSPRKLRAIKWSAGAYLYGVVPSECPSHPPWLPEALRLRAVVARSYALATRRTGAFDLFPDRAASVSRDGPREALDNRSRQRRPPARSSCISVKSQRRISSRRRRGPHGRRQRTSGVSRPLSRLGPDPYDSISPHHDWGPLVSRAKLAKAMKMKGRVVDLQPEHQRRGRSNRSTRRGRRTRSPCGRGRPPSARTRSTLFSVSVLSLTAPPQPVSTEGGAS